MHHQHLFLFHYVSGHGSFLVMSSPAQVIHFVCSPPWLHELCLSADLFQIWLNFEKGKGRQTFWLGMDIGMEVIPAVVLLCEKSIINYSFFLHLVKFICYCSEYITCWSFKLHPVDFQIFFTSTYKVSFLRFYFCLLHYINMCFTH